MTGGRLTARADPEAAPRTTRQANAPEPADRDRVFAARGFGGTGLSTAGDVLLQLQRTHGNRYVQRLVQAAAPAPVLQPRLLIGPPGDRYEREADRLAEDLAGDVAEPVPGSRREHQPLNPSSRGIRIARMARAGTAGRAVDPPVQQFVLAARGQGRPLPGNLRRRYELGLRADLAAVRLHTDSRADGLNHRLDSSAFTTGHDIFFRRGEYDPASDTGGAVLAHELVHVVQQTGGGTGGADGASLVVQRGKKKKHKISTESSSDDDAPTSMDAETTRPKRSRSPGSASSDSQTKRPKGKQSPASASQDATQQQAADEAAIRVGYLGLDGMKEYLAAQGLRTDREPEEVSVGAVVWNINHLKADDDDDVDDVDDDVTDAESEEAMPAEYDISRVNNAMAALQKALTKAGPRLNEAITAEHKRLEQTKDSTSNTRKEVSQLARDIFELSTLSLAKAFEPGINALAEWLKNRGKSSVEVRADQLETIRSLARVWKRLRRLKTVLISGSTKDKLKADAREHVRGALEQGQASSIDQAIKKLLDALPIGQLEAAVGALKRGLVMDLATDTFLKSPAVSLVLINEMNLGITHLQSAISRSEGKLGLSQGPVMLAKGKTVGEYAKGKSGLKMGTGDTEQHVVGRQYEYYPAVHRTGEQGLTPAGTFYVNTLGLFAGQEQGKNEAIGWDKAGDSFRGIVVHRFKQGKQEFWAGVLHTTPAGKDLNRVDIWPQIKKPLSTLNQLALHFKIPLLVGGDFYIPPEGIVNAPTADQQRDFNLRNPSHLGKVKAQHFARNIFRATEGMEKKQPGVVEKLIMSVTSKSTASVSTGKPGGFRMKPPTSDQQSKWDRYRKALESKYQGEASRIDLLAATNSPRLELALQLLAPGVKFPGSIEIDWQSTWAAGKIGDRDIIRNDSGPEKMPDAKRPRFTMQRALQPLDYRIVEAGSPTNPKEHGRGENKMQLADLFLVNRYWKTTRSGIVTPTTARLKPIDDAALSATRTYWKISDHSPVLMLGSTQTYSIRPHSAFDMAPKAAMKAVKANQAQWERIETSLADVETTGKPIGDQIKLIKEILQRPFIGPSWEVVNLRTLVAELNASIKVPEKTLTLKQKKALSLLRAWQHPVYTTDIGEEAPTGKGKSQASGREHPPVPVVPQGKETAIFEGKGTSDPVALTLSPQIQADWPTGEMVNVDNSCYLAAVIHVLASHQVFRDLLDGQKNPLPGNVNQQIQASLATLVTRLRNPQETIWAADMKVFMESLDKLTVVLANGPRSTTTNQPPKPNYKPAQPAMPSFKRTPADPAVKQSPKPATGPSAKLLPAKAPPPTMPSAKAPQVKATEEVTKRATGIAVEATERRSVYGLQQDASEILLNLLDLLTPSDAAQTGVQAGIKKEMRSEITSRLVPVAGGEASRKLVSSPLIQLGLVPAVTSIAEALKHYSATETVSYGNPISPHYKQLLFNKLPTVLTLSLNRFDATGTKITREVTADDPLDIPAECLSSELKQSLQGQPAPRYRLLHVIHHSGESIGGGHYTSYGRLPDGSWYKHDDAQLPGLRRGIPGPEARRWALNRGYIYVYVRTQ